MRITTVLLRLIRNRKLIMAVAIMAGHFALAAPVMAATYYVATNGSNSNAGSTTAPFLTIQKGLSVLSAGDTLVIRNGTYSDSLSNLPNGSSGNYITIMAESEGNVIITGGLSMAQGNQYLIFQGLRFQDNNQKNIFGNHLKFFRNEFKGGPASGNTVTVAIGSNDFTPAAQFVLMEDNWVHGFGGRYKVLVYNSDSIVLRRMVTRFDGYNSADNAPEADITVYDSSNVEVQNPIAIDGLTGSLAAYYVAAFYNICNGTTSTQSINHFWRGAMAIMPTGYLMGTEGNCTTTNQLVQDAVLAGGTYGVSQLKGSNIQYIRVTIIGTKGDGFGLWGGSATVKDSIVANASGMAFNGISPSTSVAYNNSGGNTGGTVLNPFTSGLLYLPRIEAGSVLSSGGTGGQRGAQIVKRIGTPGTLYGESGYTTTTATDLWPWPNEARIKKEMCTDAGVTRGFCSSTSLTEYILSYLGNPNPYGGGVIALSPPPNLRVQ